MAREGARRPAVLVVEDEQFQRRHERVAGTGVAKAPAVVCTRLPPGRRQRLRRPVTLQVRPARLRGRQAVRPYLMPRALA